MPIIRFESGSLSERTKQDLIDELTNTAARVTNIPVSAFVVTINEIPDENFAIGGVTVEKIKRKHALEAVKD